MTAIEHNFDPYRPYRSTLLSRERLRELSSLRPRRVVLDTAMCWLLIVGAWLVAAQLRTWWGFAIAGAVVGNRYYALYIIGHDGLHRRLLNGVRANDLYCDLLLLGPIGGITRINNRNHILHHQNLARPEDPDRHRHGCFNKVTRAELLSYLTAISSLGRSLSNVFLGRERSAKVEPGRAPEGGASSRRYGLRDILILVGWQVVLFSGLTWAFGPWGYAAMWLAPVFLFTFLGDNFRSFVEHSHPESDEKADRHRLVTHHPTRLERALVSPMNMNYHAAHHLWPSIPYYNLPLADRDLRVAAHGDSTLSWRRSYVGYLWRYWRRLPLDECRVQATSV